VVPFSRPYPPSRQSTGGVRDRDPPKVPHPRLQSAISSVSVMLRRCCDRACGAGRWKFRRRANGNFDFDDDGGDWRIEYSQENSTASARISQNKIRLRIVGFKTHFRSRRTLLSSLVTIRYNDEIRLKILRHLSARYFTSFRFRVTGSVFAVRGNLSAGNVGP
jgi:hypothetical protein